MDNLSALLSQLNNKETLDQLSKTVDAKPNQVKELTQTALPMLLEALRRNASSQEGANSLNKALDQHQNDDIGNLLGFLKNVDTKDGSKILDHVLGSKNETIQNKLASNSGLDISQVGGLLSQYAPLIMAFLASQKKQTNSSVNSSGGLAGGLGALLGGSNSSDLLGMASKFLDADGDGDITDDLSKMLGGFLKK